MIVGMDFGTTNSGMAVYDGQDVRILPLDPANSNAQVIRTAVYTTNKQDIHIGRAAIDTYFSQNVGRAVKTKKVWVGEIEVRGGDMFYVTDVYVYVDVLAPGRLFLSIKTGLRDPEYTGSLVGSHFYSLEDIVALYLHVTKVRAEQLLGRRLTDVVLGRPVRFAHKPEHDRLAQARLLQAALKAGYETVYFQPEPIAAAYSYATQIDQPQNVLVFDFGGGTLDLTVMHLGRNGHQVLSTGGIPVAGDLFDQKLVRAKLPPHFGEGSYFGPRHKKLEVPPWIYDSFSNWQTILELQTLQNRQLLESMAQTAQRRHQIEALISLVANNYGQQMFDIVERTKRELSLKRGAQIHLQGPGFNVIEFVTRGEFERIIQQEILAIDRHIDQTVVDSGLTPTAVDAVIRTGGSSQIPVFDEMLRRKFGADKVRVVDTFSSVTAGLGVIGHELAHGRIQDIRPYTAADVAQMPTSGTAKAVINPVNLELLQRRILVQEGAIQDNSPTVTQALVWLGPGQQITAVPLPTVGESWAETGPTAVTAAIIAELDEQLLCVTSQYRFLLVTARQLLEWQSAGVQIGQLYLLAERETLCSLSRWEAAKAQQKLLIVTSLGFARPYPIAVMQESIETPVPWQFDHPLAGVPVAVVGANAEQQLVLANGKSQAVRYEVGQLRGSGRQIMRTDGANRVVAATVCQAETVLWMATADGYGRRALASWIELAEKENSRGKMSIARKSPLVGLAEGPVWGVSNQRVLGLAEVPLELSSKSYAAVTLQPEEALLAILPAPMG